MKICLQKISEHEHRVRVIRTDGSGDQRVLNTRSFLRHDFAHFAVESEVPFNRGYWGNVAAGATLSGVMGGKELMLAEQVSGPVQTLIRIEAGREKYQEVLQRFLPGLATTDLATRIQEAGRRLEGHWRSTPFGESMEIVWQGSGGS